MHRAARLVGEGLGHEGRADAVLERGFMQGALEHDELIGQAQGIAVAEVDLHLRRAAFVAKGVQVELLGIAPAVKVLE
ncbi:hypothetical protein D3C81_1432370 [compost metagenome]